MSIQLTICADNATELQKVLRELCNPTVQGGTVTNFTPSITVTTASTTPASIQLEPTASMGQPALALAAVPTVPPAISASAPASAPAAAAPTSANTYTLDQLAAAATQLVDAGRREELVQLLARFGVQTLTSLSKEQYGAFAAALRQMGTEI